MSRDDVRELLPEYVLGTLEPADAARVEAALTRSEELRREAGALSRALFAIPESLDPADVGQAEWEQLRDITFGAETGGGERVSSHDTHRAPHPAGSPTRGAAIGGLASWLRPPRSGLVLAACLALALGLGGWGWQAAQDRAQLAQEQRITAYWMRHPDLEITALEGVGAGAVAPGAERAEVPAGVVCVLPDGRAMLLQPYAAPGGTSYRLVGIRDGRRVDLGSTQGRFLLFDASGLSRVEVELEGRTDGLIARAEL